jgi:large-conductance mechanosensitive channel
MTDLTVNSPGLTTLTIVSMLIVATAVFFFVRYFVRARKRKKAGN